MRRKANYCKNCKPMPRRSEKLYHIYYGIIARCYNKNNPKYDIYGRKGVDICEEWLNNYESFKLWALANGYYDGLTIDRINSDGNYEPNNCRWITRKDNSIRANQHRHKNKTKLGMCYAISPEGEYIYFDNILKFSKIYGLNYSSVNARLHGRIISKYKGWDIGILNDIKKRNDYRNGI